MAGRRLLAALALCGLASLVSGQSGSESGTAQAPTGQTQGPPAPEPVPQGVPTVQGILVEGEERYTEEQLIAALGQRIGQPLAMTSIDAGLKRLWSSFHVLGEVSVREVAGGVELRLEVRELPSDREPRFVGNVDVDLDDLKRWALLEDKTELFLHQATAVRARLIEGYRREGYYFAEVNIVTRGGDEESGALPDVIFEIREGPKVRVKDVLIEGNDSLPDTTFLLFWKDGVSHLAKRELKGPRLFNWFGSPFVEETLDADLLAMREVYRDYGWLDAVVEVDRLEFNDERKGVSIHIAVDEGERYTVSSLDIRAYDWAAPEDPRNGAVVDAELRFPEEELIGLCSLLPGEPFEKSLRQKDEAALRDHYGAVGFLSHPSLPRDVNWTFGIPELTFDYEAHTIAVTYRLLQGRPLTIGEIKFAGTQHTRDRVLRRELSVVPGEVANLVEIQRSLSRITGTRYFSDELNRLEHEDPRFRFQEPPSKQDGDPSAGDVAVSDPQADVIDLIYEVDEGRVVDFQISGGVQSDDGLFGLLSLTMRNFDITDLPRSWSSTFSEIYQKQAFHGAGQLLQIDLAPGTQVSRARLRFVEPDIFRLHLNPISFDFDLHKRLRRFDTHDEDRFTRAVRFGRKLDHDSSVSVGYVNELIEVDDLDANVPPLLALQETKGQETLSGVSASYFRRDLDRLIVPSRGYRVRLENTVYGGPFQGSYDYNKTEFLWEFYLPTGELDDGTKPGLHVEVNGGTSAPYDGTNDIPYSERYFLGGARTLRGFDFRGVGPFDSGSGQPLGGETFFAGTVEWNYPLHSIQRPGTFDRIESLRGSLFVDWGILDPEAFTLDAQEFRASAGFSVGLVFPIPLTLNFGWPIRDQPGDDKQVFSFRLRIN